MIIKESEIRKIIKNEIIKKSRNSKIKNLVRSAVNKINERKETYTAMNSEVISEIYGDPSYSGKAVAYGDSPYGQPAGSSGSPYGGGTQQARPSDPAPATAAAPPARSGIRYSASDKFPIKKGDKDGSGSNRIKKLQAKIGTKADGMYGPKSAGKVKELHGVETVSEELYNKIMGIEGRVDVTTGPEGGDQQLGTGGARRQVTRQASGGKYRIKKKKRGTIKIDPVGKMERTIKNAVVSYLNQQDPANAKAHKKVRVGRVLIDLQNPNVDDFGKEEFMSASVRLKGDLGRLPAIGRGREASSVVKRAVWSGLKAAGILEV